MTPMSILTKALLVVIAVLGLAVGIQTWRVHSRQNDAVEAGVKPAKDAATVAAAQVETVTTVLAGQRDTVARLITRVLHDTIPAAVLHPVTPEDTASAVATLPTVVAQRDSIAQRCREYVLTCDEYRARAQARFRADSLVIAAQDAVLKTRPPTRHWHLGLGPSCSAIAVSGRVVSGCGVSAGYYWTPF